MSGHASLLNHQSSIFDLDYISGIELPKGLGVADRVLDIFQSFSELDTLTGDSIDAGLGSANPQSYLDALAEWRTTQSDPILELLKRSRSGEPRDRAAPQASFEPLQEWEGYVTSVSESSFSARLLDITANANFESEQADFSLDDVSDDDRVLVDVGSIFRWSVGYEKKVSGTRRKVSSIVFRRLPIWTRREIDSARARAEILVDSINWE